MANFNLYYRTQLESNVKILPDQLNGNLDENILENLKQKVENKTNEYGIVLRVLNLIDYDNGMIDKANFMAITSFIVKYECYICSPIQNMEIICVVSNFIHGYIVAENGPVTAIIEYNNIDRQKFEFVGDKILDINTKHEIKQDTYLRVSIINIKKNMGKQKIITICKLLSLATDQEITTYNNDLKLTNSNNSDINVDSDMDDDIMI